MKSVLIYLAISILSIGAASNQTEEQILKFEENHGATLSRKIDMGVSRFALLIGKSDKPGGDLVKRTLYRYTNALKLLWVLDISEDDFGYSTVFASPDGQTIYIAREYDADILIIDNNGEVRKMSTVGPKKMTHYFSFADDDKLNIVYKNSKQSYKHSTSEKEPLHWVTINESGEEDSKAFSLPIPETPSSKVDYWEMYTNVDQTAYLYRECSPKKEAEYTEFLSVNFDEKINVFKIVDPDELITTNGLGLDDKSVKIEVGLGRIYARYIIDEGAKFQIISSDLEGNEIWNTKHKFKDKLEV
ncbi:MAG: hypothetical protein HRT57_02945, partial [Crocinitomicaceae bacterium]|nr:hypothetical protein [Crocinitomicaceae bacterium]